MFTATTRKIALVVGAFYVGLGVLGFIPGISLSGLATDPVHSFAHILVGLLALWASQSAETRSAMTAAAALFVLLMLAPVAAPLTASAMYFASALICGYAAFGEREARRTA